MPIRTVADLLAENCNLMLTCRGCGRINTKTPYALVGMALAPDGKVPVAAMEAMTIEAVLARVKCSRCGGREADWTVVRRVY